MKNFYKWFMIVSLFTLSLISATPAVAVDNPPIFSNDVYSLERVWPEIPNAFKVCAISGNFTSVDLIYRTVKIDNGTFSDLPGTSEKGITLTGDLCTTIIFPYDYSLYDTQNSNVLFLFRFVFNLGASVRPNDSEKDNKNVVKVDPFFWYTNYFSSFASYKPIDIKLDCTSQGNECAYNLSSPQSTGIYPNNPDLMLQFKDLDATSYPLSSLNNGVSINGACAATTQSALNVVLTNASTGPDDMHGMTIVNPIAIPITCHAQKPSIAYASSLWSCSGDQCVGDDIVHYACPKAYTWPNDPQTYYCGTGKPSSQISYEIDFCPENRPTPHAKPLAYTPIPSQFSNAIRLSSEFKKYDASYGYTTALQNCKDTIFAKGGASKGSMYACAHLPKDKLVKDSWSCDLKGGKCDYVDPNNPTPGDGIMVQWDCNDIKQMFGSTPDWCQSTPPQKTSAGNNSNGQPSGMTVTLKNYCKEEILVGYSGPTSLEPGNPPKWNLAAYTSGSADSTQVNVPDTWTGTSLPDCDSITDMNACYATPRCAWNANNVCGRVNGPRFWPRTGCKYDQTTNVAQCETGDCGGRYDCGQPALRQAKNCQDAASAGDCQTISGCTWYHNGSGDLGCLKSPLAGDGNISLIEMCFTCTQGMTCLDACRSADTGCQDSARKNFNDNPDLYKRFCPASCFNYAKHPDWYLCQPGDTDCQSKSANCASNPNWVNPINFTAYDISLVDAVNIKVDVVPIHPPAKPESPGINPAFWCGTGLCSSEPIQSFFDVCGNTNTPLDVTNVNTTQGYLFYNDQTPMFLPGETRNPVACFSNCGQTRYPLQPKKDSTSPRYKKWNKYCCQNEWTANPACCHAWYSGRMDININVGGKLEKMVNSNGCCIGPLCTWPFGQPIVCNNDTLYPTPKDKENCMNSNCCTDSQLGPDFCKMMPGDAPTRPNNYASCELDTGQNTKNIIWVGELNYQATQNAQGSWDVTISWQKATTTDQSGESISYDATLDGSNKQSSTCGSGTPLCSAKFTIPNGGDLNHSVTVSAEASGYTSANKDIAFTLGSNPEFKMTLIPSP